MVPVPAVGAVQEMDSTYVEPVVPVPVLAPMVELCSTTLIVPPPMRSFTQLAGRPELARVPAFAAVVVPAPALSTAATWNPNPGKLLVVVLVPVILMV